MTLRIDFLNADKNTMSKMLRRFIQTEFCGWNMRVLALLDLLEMNFVALFHAVGRRTNKDIPDIAWLLLINGLDTETDLHPLMVWFSNENVFCLVNAKIKEIQA